MATIKNILITGGAGFIGSHLSIALVKQGYCVTVLDNLSLQIHGDDPEQTSPLYRSIKGIVRFINGSVLSHNDLTQSIQDQDCIIHLAAETGTGQSMYDITKYVNVNIQGTALLTEILTTRTHSIKKIILASSRAVYGEGMNFCKNCGMIAPQARRIEDIQLECFDCKCPKCGAVLEMLPTPEEFQPTPQSIYAITKQTQEQIILNYCHTSGIPGLVFRYQNVFGPGQSLTNPYTGILSIFSTQIRNENTIDIYEDGLESRDFVYIDDVVQATIMGVTNHSIGVYNVGSGISTNIHTVVENLQQHLGNSTKTIISGNYRIGDIRHACADISKIKRVFGWKPKWSFEDGLRKFCCWVDKQDIRDDLSNASSIELMMFNLLKKKND